MTERHTPRVADPEWVTRVFHSTRYSWIWLVIRVYVGYEWLVAGFEKVTGKGWVDGGAALKGFWTGAVKVPATGHPAIAYDWYRTFLGFLLNHDAHTWFAPLVAYAEMTIGICLIAGLLTGFAAFGGALMNFNFMLAGSASTNPVMFLGAMLVFLAWKVAGHLGLDYYVLPALGTPWHYSEKALPPLANEH